MLSSIKNEHETWFCAFDDDMTTFYGILFVQKCKAPFIPEASPDWMLSLLYAKYMVEEIPNTSLAFHTHWYPANYEFIDVSLWTTAKAKCFKTNSLKTALFLGNSTQVTMVSDRTRENLINKNDYITCNQVNPLLCVELWSIQPLCGKIWMVIISTRQESRRKQEEELRRGAPLLRWLVRADDTSCSEGISYRSSVSSLNVAHKTGHVDVNSTVSIVQLTL